MGKTTLYHPIDLQVLRGAAAHGGFRFGKIVQIRASVESGIALYHAFIVGFPTDIVFKTTPRIWEALQQCFMDDVKIIRMGEREFGGIECWIATCVAQGGAE